MGKKAKKRRPPTLDRADRGPWGGIKGGVNPSLGVMEGMGGWVDGTWPPLNHLTARGLVGLTYVINTSSYFEHRDVILIALNRFIPVGFAMMPLLLVLAFLICSNT